jgi:hypothetical protein
MLFSHRFSQEAGENLGFEFLKRAFLKLELN